MELLTFEDLHQLRRIRQEFELTIEEASEGIGISQSFLRHIEKGRRKPSEQVLERINNYYRWVEGTFVKKDLTVQFDYLRVTFKTLNVEKVLSEVFWIDYDQLLSTERAPLYGYEQMMYFDGVYVCWSKTGDHAGMMVEMRGVGTALFTYLLEKQKRDWTQFFKELNRFDYQIGRLDVAIDDYKGYLDLPLLKRKVDREEYESDFDKVWAIFGNRKRKDKEMGTTVYFGARKSNMHICFYQKNIELSEKLNRPVETIDVLNRYEIRLMNERADKFVELFLKGERTLGELAMSIIRDKVTFLISKRDGSGEYVEWKKWQDFVGRGEGIDLSVAEIERSYEKTLLWLANQTFPSLKAVRQIEDTLGFDRLDRLYEQVELNEDKRRFIEQACKKLSDLSMEQEVS